MHGLRTTFRTWAQDQGYPDELAEPALAHDKRSKVARAYARSDVLERRREMMQAWADFCTGGKANAED